MTPVRVRIFPILMAIFIIVPIIEIYLLIQIGGIIGVLPTIALVILTAVVGAALLRIQGFQTYMRFNQAFAEGRLPATEIIEGVALLIGGALLLTPGFFTDIIGFLCLIPFSRRALIALIATRFNPLAGASRSQEAKQRRPSQASGNIYEGSVTRHHDE